MLLIEQKEGEDQGPYLVRVFKPDVHVHTIRRLQLSMQSTHRDQCQIYRSVVYILKIK